MLDLVDVDGDGVLDRRPMELLKGGDHCDRHKRDHKERKRKDAHDLLIFGSVDAIPLRKHGQRTDRQKREHGTAHSNDQRKQKRPK